MQAEVLEGRRVLIAEDSWQIAFGLKAILEEVGALVVGPAPSLARACRLVEEEAIELGLIDINLRDERAHPLLDLLSARGIRSVVISGYQNPGEFNGHTVAVLSKPVQTDRLLSAMRSACRATG